MLDLKVINEFRNLAPDISIVFDNRLTLVLGTNGSGKSSIFQAIRGYYNRSTSSDKMKNSSSLYVDTFQELNKNVEITTDYASVIAFDAIADNPLDMNNSYDASAFIKGGGYAAQRLSHGERSKLSFGNLITDIEQLDTTKRHLIILDEVDVGFDIKWQTRFGVIVSNMLLKFPHIDIVVTTHSSIVIDAFNSTGDNECYYMDDHMYMPITEVLEDLQKLK